MLPMQRKRSIPSVANDVNEQSVWYLPLDLRNVQNAVGIMNQPTIHAIAAGELVHGKPQQIAPASAVVDDLFPRPLAVQAGSSEGFAPQPDVCHSVPVFGIRRISA